MSEQEWYTNKELYEMMVDLSKGLETTNKELEKTQVMIREYNGLRARIDECEKKQRESVGKVRWQQRYVGLCSRSHWFNISPCFDDC